MYILLPVGYATCYCRYKLQNPLCHSSSQKYPPMLLWSYCQVHSRCSGGMCQLFIKHCNGMGVDYSVTILNIACYVAVIINTLNLHHEYEYFSTHANPLTRIFNSRVKGVCMSGKSYQQNMEADKWGTYTCMPVWVLMYAWSMTTQNHGIINCAYRSNLCDDNGCCGTNTDTLCIQQVEKDDDGHYRCILKKQYKGKSWNVQFIVSVLHLMQGLDISCLTYPHSLLHISVSSQNYSASKTSNSSHWNENNFLCWGHRWWPKVSVAERWHGSRWWS